MPYRCRSLMFHDRWTTGERWTYSVCILLAFVVLQREVFPLDWPHVFLPLAVAVPVVYFFFGRWPGIVFLPASGLAALWLAPDYGLFTLRNVTEFALYVLQGSISCWLIDQLQQAMLAIQHEEHLKDEVLSTQTDWVMRTDASGHFDYVNPAAATTLGLTVTEAVGKSWKRIASPEDLPVVEARLANLSPSNPIVIGENGVRDAGGRVIWGHFINRGFFDADGRLTGILTVGRNITERKQLEQQLMELAKDYEDLYQQAPCAHYSIDANGGFVKVNRTLCDWLGLSAAELVGQRHIQEFLTAESAALFRERYPLFMQQGSLQSVTFELRSHSGTRRWVLVDSNAVYDPTGRYLHSRSVMSDITARVQAEAAFHRLNDSLEQRVRERTAELQHTTDELESFTYSLSHDLRAPIRTINATASILLEDCKPSLTPDLDAGLAKIKQASRHMAQLMDAMLALNALGSPSAPQLPFSHATLVQSALDTLLPKDSPRRAQIIIQALPTSAGNPRRMQRVWENLLSNALKFTEQVHEPQIDVGFDAERKACYVRDNGVGFDMRYADKLFKPFERLHDGRQYDGDGIGLAIAEKIVRGQGGRIWCEATPGDGATFYFTT